MSQESNVYFTNLRTSPGVNLLQKLERLINKAGFKDIDFENKFTAIKIHFGEPGNLAYIRPNYAAVVAEMVKKAGGRPYLTDSNTLYSGKRSNAVDHLQSAAKNGFTEIVTGCPVIIADGLKGTDETEIPVNLNHTENARIGRAVAESDVIISMSHFKGHEFAGFGGTLKNMGMGSASVGGKLFLHSSSKPRIEESNCTACKICEKNCAHDAIKVVNKIAVIDYDNCVGCGQCVAVCQYDSAQVVWGGGSELMNEKIAEYGYAILKDKPSLHISFMTDISPDCDCWGYNDYPLVPNIGIAASTDPVALDMACAEMVKKAPIMAQSKIGDKHEDGCGLDKFSLAHPNTDWEAGLKHAEKINLGTRQYNLIEV